MSLWFPQFAVCLFSLLDHSLFHTASHSLNSAGKQAEISHFMKGQRSPIRRALAMKVLSHSKPNPSLSPETGFGSQLLLRLSATHSWHPHRAVRAAWGRAAATTGISGIGMTLEDLQSGRCTSAEQHCQQTRQSHSSCTFPFSLPFGLSLVQLEL